MPIASNVGKCDLALASSTAPGVARSRGPGQLPDWELPATAAQGTLEGLELHVVADSQGTGIVLDDPAEQCWPGVVARVLPGASVTNHSIAGATSADLLPSLLAIADADAAFIILWGRNNLNQALGLASIQADTQAAVAHIGARPYLIVTIPLQDDVAGGHPETTADTLAYNAWLVATYPGRVVDSNAAYAANADPTSADDLADVAADLTPRSLRFDYVHMNEAGEQVLAQAVLGLLAVLSPAAGRLLEPKSLAGTLGLQAAAATPNRTNAWQRLQKFVAGFTSAGIAWIQGDGHGLIVDGTTAANRRFGIMKWLGFTGTFMRSVGVAVLFQRSGSATDVSDVGAARTTELSWGDAGWLYAAPVHVAGNNVGLAFDNGPTFKRLAIVNKAGFYPQLARAAGSTINYVKSDSSSDATTGTLTVEAAWSDAGLVYAVPLAAPTAAPGTDTTQVATTAFVTAGLAPKAPLASPTFTGTVAAAAIAATSLAVTKATTGTIATFGANGVPGLLTISYDVTSAAAVGLTGSPFGSLDLLTQANQNIRLVPHGTGKTIVTKTGMGDILSLGANGVADLLVVSYNSTSGNGIGITGSVFGSLDLLTQNNKDIRLDPHGTGQVAVTKALAVAGALGLNGTAPVAKGTITGSRADGTALASLLTYLASRGDVTDSSVP